FHIARNARADYFHRQPGPRAQPDPEVEPVSGAPYPGEQMERDEAARLLRRALLALPAEKREILLLARYRELKHEEIAGLLGVKTGAVEARVHRARKELRDVYRQLSERKTPCVVKSSETSWPIT